MRGIVARLDPALLALAHDGPQAFRGRFELIYRRRAARPNDVWQIDHTELDLLVLDRSTAGGDGGEHQLSGVSFDSVPRTREPSTPPFGTLEEWTDDASQCAPTRSEDGSVIAGQAGARRRATHDELVAILAEHRAGQAVERWSTDEDS